MVQFSVNSVACVVCELKIIMMKNKVLDCPSGQGLAKAAVCFIWERVLVVLLHACFSVVGPIPFILAAILSYTGSTLHFPILVITLTRV